MYRADDPLASCILYPIDRMPGGGRRSLRCFYADALRGERSAQPASDRRRGLTRGELRMILDGDDDLQHRPGDGLRIIYLNVVPAIWVNKGL